jgi:transposase
VFNRSQVVPAPNIIEGTTMEHYAGIDVSLESSSLCIVDATGRVVREAKIASEPEALTAWLKGLGCEIIRIGLEAGPLSQWLHAGMKQAGLPVELLETRHVRTAFKIMPVKTDRKDARGIAQLMRLGWFRPVHCKSLVAQETRAVLGARKLLQIKLHDIELSLRGTLRGFGLKVGKTTPKTFEGRVRSLAADHPTLLVVTDALLRARTVLAEQFNRLDNQAHRGGPRRQAGAAADDGTRRRVDRRADFCLGDRQSRPLQVVQDGRTVVRPDAEEIPVRGNGCDRADLEDRRRDGTHGTLRSRQCHFGTLEGGLSTAQVGPWRSQAGGDA